MYVLLPKKAGLEQFLQTLTATNWEKLEAAIQNQEGNAGIAALQAGKQIRFEQTAGEHGDAAGLYSTSKFQRHVRGAIIHRLGQTKNVC